MRRRIVISITAAITMAPPAAASADFVHTVGPGESLYSVAAADGMSVSQLAASNGLPADAQLIAGSTLVIPPQTSGAGATASGVAAPATASSGDGDSDGDDGGATGAAGPTMVSSTSSSGGSYVVMPGDTLSAIAARAGLSVDGLAAANGLDPNALLLTGTVLRLSGGGTFVSDSAGASSSAAVAQPVGAAAQGSSSGGPYPTAERVTGSQIASIASANGVPPSLAQAIGWQESGWNNDLVSSADARGVMQLLPGTWDWIGQTLAGPTPLAPASALDNVRGGVLLLHSLLQATGGDPALAAAGYYQGLPSVQRNGLYPDTQQYVNGVLALQRRFGGG